MLIQTQVAGRWMVNLSCMVATEAQCLDALAKVDCADLEKLKP